jgi:hypothetical protein
VLKTPPRTPQANAICERGIGSLRRDCLDFLIPLSENPLRRQIKAWVAHYNQGRPHMALGPGIPDPPAHLPVPPQAHRHRLPADVRVVAHPVLGGLHHEYTLEKNRCLIIRILIFAHYRCAIVRRCCDHREIPSGNQSQNRYRTVPPRKRR